MPAARPAPTNRRVIPPPPEPRRFGGRMTARPSLSRQPLARKPARAGAARGARGSRRRRATRAGRRRPWLAASGPPWPRNSGGGGAPVGAAGGPVDGALVAKPPRRRAVARPGRRRRGPAAARPVEAAAASPARAPSVSSAPRASASARLIAASAMSTRSNSLGQRLDDGAVAVEVARDQRLAQRCRGAGPGAARARRRPSAAPAISSGCADRPLDVPQQPVLARLDERDRDALAPGAPRPADAVDVDVGRRRARRS